MALSLDVNERLEYFHSRKFSPYYKESADEIKLIESKGDEELECIWMNCWLRGMVENNFYKDEDKVRNEHTLTKKDPGDFFPNPLPDGITKEEAAKVNKFFILRRVIYNIVEDILIRKEKEELDLD